MKQLANIKGAKALNKKEQQNINGGGIVGGCRNRPNGTYCAGGHWCCDGVCTPYDDFNDYVLSCRNGHIGHDWE